MTEIHKDQIPLAERIRPQNFEHFFGQKKRLGANSVLRDVIENSVVSSMIFWGPPGTGKTTLAKMIANYQKKPFHQLNAIDAGVKQVREIIQQAGKHSLMGSGSAILFIDEIHRFNKSQQDSLLHAVEQGIITLIGATTENPSFEVNAALLSRCEVVVLESLGVEDLKQVIQRAISEDTQLNKRNIEIAEYDALLRISGGDARKLLNALELICKVHISDPLVITDELCRNTVQQNLARYDKTGEQHYDIISALIKSIRGSDPNAAVYYLARMIEGGEDPVFIARRLLISASEDIGNANPTALVMATNAFQAVRFIGYPEARIILSQTAVYLASSPKSNASYAAIGMAQSKVRETGDLSVPLHLRNAPTKLMKELGYGEAYQYSHDYTHNFSGQEYLPEEIAGTVFYQPGKNAREEEMRKRLAALWKDKYGY